MVGDIEIGNDITERGSIEGKKKGPRTEPWGTPYGSEKASEKLFLLTVVLTVPGTVKVVEIFRLFQSSNLLLISLSNSLVIVLVSMPPLFRMLFLMGFVYPSSLDPFRQQLKTCLIPRHTHLSLNHTLMFSVVLNLFSVPGY